MSSTYAIQVDYHGCHCVDRIGSRGVFEPKEAQAYVIANKQRAGLWGSTSERGLKVFVRYMAITRVE